MYCSTNHYHSISLFCSPQVLHYSVVHTHFTSVYEDICDNRYTTISGGGKGWRRRGHAPRRHCAADGIWKGENMEFWKLALSGELAFALQTVIVLYPFNTPPVLGSHRLSVLHDSTQSSVYITKLTPLLLICYKTRRFILSS